MQRAGVHLRWDRDGDGICEGFADAVGAGGAQRWFVILRRSSREAAAPEIGNEQVDVLEMDWIGRGRPTLVLRGHTPLDRVKTRLFVVTLDLDGDGVLDLDIEYHAPREFPWVVAYRYRDSGLRPDLTGPADRWQGRLAFQMVRLFYDAEYFFHYGGTAPVPPIGAGCP